MVRWILTLIVAIILIGAPITYYRLQRACFRNFRLVQPGILYRSGQMNGAGFRRIVRDYGIRTVVTLRESDHLKKAEGQATQWEENYCRENGIAYVRIQVREWWSPDGPAPALAPLEEFLEVMRHPERFPRPVLVHCFAGKHRTGAFVAIYRMEFDRWPVQKAIEEMRRCGYVTINKEWDVRDFLLNYQPSWKRTSAVRPDS